MSTPRATARAGRRSMELAHEDLLVRLDLESVPRPLPGDRSGMAFESGPAQLATGLRLGGGDAGVYVARSAAGVGTCTAAAAIAEVRRGPSLVSRNTEDRLADDLIRAGRCRGGANTSRSRLLESISNDRWTTWRVSSGAITASTKPRSAATQGVRYRSEYSASSSGSSAGSARRCRIWTAPRDPMTATSALGQARQMSLPIPFESRTMYGAAIGLAQDEADPRHRRLGVRERELCAVADHPAPFEVLAG